MKVFNLIILTIAIVCVAIFVFIATQCLIEFLRRNKLSKESLFQNNEDLRYAKNQDSSLTWLLRNGIGFLNKPCKFMVDKISYLSNLFGSIVELLEEKNIRAQKHTIASTILFISLLLATIIALLFASPIAGIAVVLLVFVSFTSSLRVTLEKRTNKIRSSIPDALRSMSTCFGAGYTLYQTFKQLTNETKGGLNRLFNRCTHILQTGGTVTQALQPLKDSTETPELTFVAVALDVQHQTGGSMKPVIESAKDMIENKLELLRLLHVQTAQAKLSSRIVIILPFALIAVFSLISPNFLAPFFSSFIGICFFLVACVMQTAGVILVKKTLKVVV